MTKDRPVNASAYQEAQSPLLRQVRSCTICAGKLPFAPRPVLNFAPAAKILIASQAPGTRVQHTGIPWNDPSGERLRQWLAVHPREFYDPQKFAIVPMGFCYPGKGRSGDLPPRRECAAHWLTSILDSLPCIETTLLVGRYSQDHFLGDQSEGVTNNVKNWRKFAPRYIPLPHPSPRNNLWLRRNPWFETELLPYLKHHCARTLRQPAKM